jgi:hypothetical protein
MAVKRFPIFAFAAFALACGGDDRPVLNIATDGTSFERGAVPSTAASPIAFVPFVTRNRGNTTAFIPACGERPTAVIERLVRGSWESYSGTFCIDNLISTPLELRAGANRRDEVAIGDAGRFRIRLSYTSDASGSEPRSTASGAFDVH